MEKKFLTFSSVFFTQRFFFARGIIFRIHLKTLFFVFSKHALVLIKVGCIRAKDEELWNDDERKEREGEERKREEPSRVFLRTRRRFRKGKKKKKKR